MQEGHRVAQRIRAQPRQRLAEGDLALSREPRFPVVHADVSFAL